MAAADPTTERLLREGRAAFERGEFREARKHLAQAHLRAPAHRELGFWLAAAQYHLGNVAKARELLVPLAEGPPPLAERPAAIHEYLCRCALPREPSEAMAFATMGVQLDPGDPRMRLVAGNACFRLKRVDEAIAHYDAALEAERRSGGPAFPRHPGQVPFARSSALMEQKRWEEARDAAEQAIEREEGNAAYHNRLGLILFEGLGDAEAAARAARRAVELDPRTLTSGGDGVYPYNLALYLERLGRTREALEAADRAISVSPRAEYRALRERLLAEVQRSPEAPRPGTPDVLDFEDVGGMKGLKEQARRILEVVHLRRDDARRYGIVRNGILLYGPPGCGKTFFAEALAGEFGLHFVRVPLSSALTKYVGSAGEAVEKVFADARGRLPCLLFFDEFDAVAARRDDAGSHHEQQLVNALLQQIDRHRDVPGLVIAAATNRLHEIDPAAVREGRFDYKVKIYRPDFDARREILEVMLRDRPFDGSIDVGELAQQTEGFSAAQLRHVVDLAALAAMEADAPISAGHLREALRERLRGGRRAATLGWGDLVLPEETLRRLQFVERCIENPGLARRLGVAPPTGVLLHGPPGTGKTTVARVLAAETDASFHAVNAADVMSKYLGESERRVKELFEAARDSVPSIVFIDEVEALLGHRQADASSGGRAMNAVVNTFLAEMDGVDSEGRVFVIAATNRPELLDAAVLRAGRLGESIEIGLPDGGGRLALLRLHAEKMSLADDVDLEALAGATEGASGADLRGLCTAAGRNALLRELDAGSESPAVAMDDFRAALRELFPGEAWAPRTIGFAVPAGGEGPGGATPRPR